MGFTLIFDAWRFGGQMSLKKGVLKKIIWSHCLTTQRLAGACWPCRHACVKDSVKVVIDGDEGTGRTDHAGFGTLPTLLIRLSPGAQGSSSKLYFRKVSQEGQEGQVPGG